MSDSYNMRPEIQAELTRCFNDYYDNLVRSARRLLDEPSLAEDAVQEVFITAAKYPEKFYASPNHSFWLMGTLKYNAMHINRDRKLLKNRFLPVEDVPEEAVSVKDTYSSELIDDPDIKLLNEFYVYGLSIKELAARYHCGESAMKMRLKRAKEKARKLL